MNLTSQLAVGFYLTYNDVIMTEIHLRFVTGHHIRVKRLVSVYTFIKLHDRHISRWRYYSTPTATEELRAPDVAHTTHTVSVNG